MSLYQEKSLFVFEASTSQTAACVSLSQQAYFVGQIELYTHIPVMKQLVEALQKWNFNVCSVYLIDSQFLIEASKFVSGVLTALSTMVNLETAHVNVMTKLDLLSKKDKKQLDRSKQLYTLSMLLGSITDNYEDFLALLSSL